MSIGDQITADIDALRAALEAEIIGDRMTTAGQAPDSGNLTIDALDKVPRRFREPKPEPTEYLRASEINVGFPMALTPYGQSVFRPSVEIIEVEPGVKYRQARTHHRRRINKKWRKRFGVIREPDYYLGDKILWDRRSGKYYCHPPTARKIEYEMLKRNQ